MTKPSRWLPLIAAGVLVVFFARFNQTVPQTAETPTLEAVNLPDPAPPNTAAIAIPKQDLATSRTGKAEPEPTQTPKSAIDAERPAQIDNLRIGSLWGKESIEELIQFSEWVNNLPPNATPAQIVAGLELAKKRKARMVELIRSDPELALAYAIPFEVRQKLPPAFATELENTISAEGHYYTLAGLFDRLPSDGQASWLEAQIGETGFRAYTYGGRKEPAEYKETPIHGIALGTDLAVSDNAVRLVSDAEAAFLAEQGQFENARGGQCPTCKNLNVVENSGKQFMAMTGAGLVAFTSRAHLNIYNQSQLAMLSAAPLLLGNHNTPPQGSSNVAGRPPAGWAVGTNRNMLVIRVDFSDLPGAPRGMTEQDISDRFNGTGGVIEHLETSSYGQTLYTFSTNDVTPVFRMPTTAQNYAVSNLNSQLHSDARAAATAAGYDVSAYNHRIVFFDRFGGFTGNQITYGGLAAVTGTIIWQHGNMNRGILAHEMGHNLGIVHANRWAPATGGILGDAAAQALAPTDPNYANFEVEYGDKFDVMGGGLFPNNHYNHWFKNLLGWYPDSKVLSITNSGLYRVNLFDDRFSDINNVLALKIVRDQNRNYWVGYRGLNANNSSNNLQRSAYVIWGYNQRRGSSLLVMNGSPTNQPSTGAGLEIGQQFSDPASGVSLRTTEIGGAGPSRYADVQIDLLPRIEFAERIQHVEQYVGAVNVALERNYNSQNLVSADFNTTDGTALAGTHYIATNGTASWGPLDVSDKVTTIPILQSTRVISNRTFTLNITNILGGVGIFDTNTTVRVHGPGSTEPVLNPGFINNGINRAVPLPNGDIVVGGNFSNIGGLPYGRVAKLNAAGTVLTNFPVSPGANTQVLDVFAQPDGKVVIGGRFQSVHNNFSESYVARLDTNGQLDTNFNLTMRPNQDVRAVAVQPDGKILVGGPFTSVGGLPYRHLARYNLDGSLDTNFVAVPFDLGTFYSVQDIALAPNGKVYIGGLFSIGGTNFPTLTNMHSGVVRLNSDGSIDTSFNIRQGAHFATFPTSPATVNAVHVKQDGDVLIGGEFTAFNSNTVSLIVRVNPDGAHDTNFVSAVIGTVITTIGEQPDGKVLIGGLFTANGATPTGNYARLNVDGTLDTTFWPGAGSLGMVRDIRYGPDHKILVAADFGGINESTRPVAKLFAGVSTRPGVVQFSTASGAAVEGNVATLTLTRSGGVDGTVSVNYGIFGGTGTNIVTGTTTSGTLVWNNGDALPKIISIPISADSFAETNEIVNVAIGVPIGGVAIGTNQLVAINVTDVPAAPVIIQNPVSVVANIGDTVTFTANAIGGQPLRYFWRLNGLNIPGTHGPTLTLTNVQPGQVGEYSLRVLNNQGFADSGSAVLAVNVPPTVSVQPISQTVAAGGNVAFTVTAIGNAPLSFQWQRNGVNIPAATVPILNLLNLVATNSGNYRVVVSNPYGNAVSQDAVLTVDSAPVIVQHPRDTVVAQGGAATFQTRALGTVPFSYQWYLNGVVMLGATNASLTVASTTGQSAGNYHAVVTNARGSSPSLPGRLTVITEELTATWAASSGGALADSGNAVAFDANGNAVVVGTFTSVANIAGASLTSAGRSDLFVVKLDPVGGLIWGNSAGGKGFDVATDVAVDAAGNIVVVGSFERSITNFFGASVTNSSVSSYADIFVAKFNSAGSLQWVKTLGQQFEQDQPASVSIDASGNILVTGSSMIDRFAGQSIPNLGRGLIAKYSAAGAELWALKMGAVDGTRLAAAPGSGGSVGDKGHAVATDSAGNVYAALSLRSLMGQFGGITLTNKGGADVVLMKLNSSGVTQWVKHAGGPNDDQVFGLAVGSDGAAYIAGDFTGVALFDALTLSNASPFLPDVFVAKCDANGNFVWAKRYGGESADGARDLAIGTGDVIVMSGYFAGTVTFGSNTLNSVGGTLDAFAAQLTSDGQLVLVQQAGGTSSEGDLGLGIAIHSDGSIAMTGAFSGTGLVGSRQLTSAGSTDVFTTRFQAAGLSAITLSFTQQPGELILRWPTGAAGYLLQSTTSSPLHTNFSDIVVAPASVGTNFVFTNATTAPRTYFRLRKP
jgi:uncharacterized delta-60 repeat protein